MRTLQAPNSRRTPKPSHDVNSTPAASPDPPFSCALLPSSTGPSRSALVLEGCVELQARIPEAPLHLHIQAGPFFSPPPATATGLGAHQHKYCSTLLETHIIIRYICMGLKRTPLHRRQPRRLCGRRWGPQHSRERKHTWRQLKSVCDAMRGACGAGGVAGLTVMRQMLPPCEEGQQAVPREARAWAKAPIAVDAGMQVCWHPPHGRDEKTPRQQPGRTQMQLTDGHGDCVCSRCVQESVRASLAGSGAGCGVRGAGCGVWVCVSVLVPVQFTCGLWESAAARSGQSMT